VLVQGVEGDPGALGYFGFAYYEENADRLKLLGVDGGTGCIQPSVETIENQTYAPLSRPLYIYVSDVGLAKPQVEAFVEYHLEQGAELVRSVGYIALQPAQYAEELERVRQLASGEPATNADAPAEDAAPAGDTTAAQ
jgi:phosphate transport system substrate-binding protein